MGQADEILEDLGKRFRNRDLAVGELQRMADEPDRLTLIGLIHPPRTGIFLFAVQAEWSWYQPETAANEFFRNATAVWEDCLWSVLSFPLDDKEQLERLAYELGLRFADGIPQVVELSPNVTVIGSHREPAAPNAKMFPCKGPNVYTIEYSKENQGGGKVLTPQQEKERMEAIWRDNGVYDNVIHLARRKL